ncbi:MAG: hypothetical protein ACXABY_05045 [Candidatus Thorarchaeota archaeon]|jgi:hypothetical protein
MADNVAVTEGAGKTIATDDVSGAQYQRIKIDLGGDGLAAPASAGAGAVGTGVQRVTLASDDPAVVDLAAIEVLLGTIDTDTSSMSTNLSTIAGAVSTEMQCDIVAALPSGTNAIGKLAPNSGVDIGDVDVTSLIPGVGATSLGKAVDTAAGATDTGVAMLAIRDDALTTLTPIDGDYVNLRVSSTGALHVTGAGGGTQYNIDDALGATDTVTLAGVVRDDSLTTLTEADGDVSVLRVSSTGALHVTGGGGGTEYTEDVATANPIVGTATLMERDDALSAVTPSEGDWIGLRGSAEGALWVQDFNSDAALALLGTMDTDTGVIAGAVAAGQMQVDIVADSAGLATDAKLDTIITALQIMDDWDDANYCNVNCNIAGVDIVGGAGIVAAGVQRVTLASDDPAVVDLAAIEALLVTIDADTSSMNTNLATIAGAVAGTEMQVDIVSSATLDVSGATVTVDLGVNNDVVAAGDIAHDAADSGNPLKVGFKAYNTDGTAPGTAVAEGDRANGISDVYGRQLVTTSHPNLWDATENNATAQTNNQLKAAPGAGLSLYITDIIISNGATAGSVKIVEDTAGTPVDRIEEMYFAANGGISKRFETPIKITANTDVGFTSTTVTTHSVTLSGYIAP